MFCERKGWLIKRPREIKIKKRTKRRNIFYSHIAFFFSSVKFLLTCISLSLSLVPFVCPLPFSSYFSFIVLFCHSSLTFLIRSAIESAYTTLLLLITRNHSKIPSLSLLIRTKQDHPAFTLTQMTDHLSQLHNQNCRQQHDRAI
ncbi:MAG: hypothetical protein JOS17DRAFT_497082 [Linnemannia elongata]|nr:MAG: hypothetical protein JOS17DRAFT_497082 [Linnemannia elongata]